MKIILEKDNSIINKIETKSARQATTHYSCDECVKKQIKHEINNITGKAKDHGGKITREFIDDLF